MPPEVEVVMFHLDYLSCLLTILATVLVGRKSWTGLLISIVNSMIVCVIGFRTSQFGFIPANLICICVYAFNIRSWVKKTHTHRIRPATGVGTTETTMVNAPYSPIVSERGFFVNRRRFAMPNPKRSNRCLPGGYGRVRNAYHQGGGGHLWDC
jgi:hypothetical protein